MSDAESDQEGQLYAQTFRNSLQKLGWTEGHNVQIDFRWAAGDAGRFHELAKELVAIQPDVIVARSTSATAALKAETRTIPIIFITVSDPIGSKIVTNISHPDANITGFGNFEPSISSKWLQLLRQIAPRVTRVAFMYDPKMAPYSSYYFGPFEVAARSFALEPLSAAVDNDADIERVITMLAGDLNGGLIILPDAFTTSDHRRQIIEQTARHYIPAIYPYQFMAAEGGLASYGVDLADLYRRSASYVDRIFRGAMPVDLPVQFPVNFELAINLKTAKSLGLDVPPMLLAVADDVIE